MRRVATASVALLLFFWCLPTYAIDVGDVFWLSSSGVGRTVVATDQAQPGVPRIQYKILEENASEYCQRYSQLKRGTLEHDKCVREILANPKVETALINCRTRVIVLDNGAFAKGDDHMWRSKADPNSFVLGDDLFKRSCSSASTASPTPQSQNSALPDSVLYVVYFDGDCRYQLVEGFFPCSSRAILIQFKDRHTVLRFDDSEVSYILDSGRDRQPNAENYFLSINGLTIDRKGKPPLLDNKMEGECHLRLNKDASRFYDIKCDIYDRSRGSSFKFYLENIRGFTRKES